MTPRAFHMMQIQISSVLSACAIASLVGRILTPCFFSSRSFSLAGSKLLSVPPLIIAADSIVVWYWTSMMPTWLVYFGFHRSLYEVGASGILLGLYRMTRLEKMCGTEYVVLMFGRICAPFGILLQSSGRS